MNTSWLDLLSNVDKMVMGSIVGSIVLAFVLLVVIFSVKIRAQQETIVQLREALREKILHIRTLEKEASEQVKTVTEAQQQKAAVEEEQAALTKRLEEARQHILEDEETIASLKRQLKEHEEQVQAEQKARRELEARLEKADEEKEAILRRNEFWVEQLSELRTKYEALRHKLKQQERA
jgi:chromosome segregation ATPase